MPRSGVNGTYTLPPNTDNQQPLTPISSSMFNAAMDDVEQTFNSVQPIAYGGTGASDAAGARASLGAGDFVGPNGGVADGQLVAFDGSTGKVGKLATMPAATVKGRASSAGTGAVSDVSVLRLGIFTPPGFATADLTPAQTGIALGNLFGFYKFALQTGDSIQMPPGAPMTYGVVTGYLNSNSLYQYSWQEFTGFSGNRKWMRRAINDTTWGPWQEIYHQGNILGTVNQSSGVPTGAIIERGSNANGGYVRYADGTLICHRRVNLTFGAANFMQFLAGVWPSAFVDSGYQIVASVETPINATVQGQALNCLRVDRLSATTFNVYQYATGLTAGANIDANLVAIGRWF